MIISITGHRPASLDGDYNLTSKLSKAIESKLKSILWDISSDCEFNKNGEQVTLMSGMALGVDTIWAKIAIETNKKLIAVIPCANQDKLWSKSSKELYYNILSHPNTTVVYTSDKEYTNGCMQVRNEYLVNNSDLLIGIWKGSNGGTKNCIDYAQSVGKQIIIINPNDLK